jgi:hypothetical protein
MDPGIGGLTTWAGGVWRCGRRSLTRRGAAARMGWVWVWCGGSLLWRGRGRRLSEVVGLWEEWSGAEVSRGSGALRQSGQTQAVLRLEEVWVRCVRQAPGARARRWWYWWGMVGLALEPLARVLTELGVGCWARPRACGSRARRAWLGVLGSPSSLRLSDSQLSGGIIGFALEPLALMLTASGGGVEVRPRAFGSRAHG